MSLKFYNNNNNTFFQLFPGIPTTYRMTAKKKTYAPIPGLSTGISATNTQPFSSQFPPNSMNNQTQVRDPNTQDRNFSMSFDIKDHSLNNDPEVSNQNLVMNTNVHETYTNNASESANINVETQPTQHIEMYNPFDSTNTYNYVNIQTPQEYKFNNPDQQTIDQIIPPPPIFSNNSLRDDNINPPSIRKSILPPSVARRISSNQPIMKTAQITTPNQINYFIPQTVSDDNSQSSDNSSVVTNFGLTNLNTSSIQSFSNPTQENQPTQLTNPAIISPTQTSDIPTSMVTFFDPVSFDSKSNLNLQANTNQPKSQQSSIYPQTLLEPLQSVPEQPILSNNSFIDPVTFESKTNINAQTNINQNNSQQSSTSLHTPLPELPKALPEPPKLSNNQGFRLTKKKPQYYSGPIEGIGAISNTVKPLMPTFDEPVTTFKGPFFTPDQTIVQKSISPPQVLDNQSVFDINKTPNTQAITNQEPYIQLSSNTHQIENIPNQVYQQQNTAFDMSRSMPETSTKQESSGQGLFGSLKSKLGALDINKIQNSVTTFFDPTYNDVKTNPQNVSAHNQSSNLEIFVPSNIQGNQHLFQSHTSQQNVYDTGNNHYLTEPTQLYSNYENRTYDNVAQHPVASQFIIQTSTFNPPKIEKQAQDIIDYNSQPTQIQTMPPTTIMTTGTSVTGNYTQNSFDSQGTFFNVQNLQTNEPDQSVSINKNINEHNIHSSSINFFAVPSIPKQEATQNLNIPAHHLQNTNTNNYSTPYLETQVTQQSGNTKENPGFDNTLVSPMNFFSLPDVQNKVDKCNESVNISNDIQASTHINFFTVSSIKADDRPSISSTPAENIFNKQDDITNNLNSKVNIPSLQNDECKSFSMFSNYSTPSLEAQVVQNSDIKENIKNDNTLVSPINFFTLPNVENKEDKHHQSVNISNDNQTSAQINFFPVSSLRDDKPSITSVPAKNVFNDQDNIINNQNSNVNVFRIPNSQIQEHRSFTTFSNYSTPSLEKQLVQKPDTKENTSIDNTLISPMNFFSLPSVQNKDNERLYLNVNISNDDLNLFPVSSLKTDARPPITPTPTENVFNKQDNIKNNQNSQANAFTVPNLQSNESNSFTMFSSNLNIDNQINQPSQKKFETPKHLQSEIAETTIFDIEQKLNDSNQINILTSSNNQEQQLNTSILNTASTFHDNVIPYSNQFTPSNNQISTSQSMVSDLFFANPNTNYIEEIEQPKYSNNNDNKNRESSGQVSEHYPLSSLVDSELNIDKEHNNETKLDTARWETTNKLSKCDNNVQDNIEISTEKDLSELNICETCREVNKPEEKDIDDLTSQLIENITAPIQLQNPVEASLLVNPDDNITSEFNDVTTIQEESIKTDDNLYVENDNTIMLTSTDNTVSSYGWCTDSQIHPLSNISLDNKNDFSSSAKFIEDNSLFSNNTYVPTNASDEIKAEYGIVQDNNHFVLPRQISVATAPNADEIDDPNSGILDVQLIEQDAKKYFPVYDDYIIEPSETDDDKIEYRERERSSDEVVQEMDSFTDRVDKYKKLEESVVSTLNEYPTNVFNEDNHNLNKDNQKAPLYECFSNSNSQAVTLTSYFDTGNYAAETHYRKSLTSPSSNKSNPLTSPIQNATDFSPSALVPEALLKDDETYIDEPNVSPLVSPNYEELYAQNMSKYCDISNAFSNNRDNQTFNESITTASVLPNLFQPTKFSKNNDSTILPDPINFFSSNTSSNTKSEVLNEPDVNYHRLASYFSTPTKTEDHSKPFFELSQGQNHFKQNPHQILNNKIVKENTDPISDPKQISAKPFFELSQSQNHYKEDNNNLSHEKYLANFNLMKDLTSIENFTPSKESVVKRVNYFFVDYCSREIGQVSDKNAISKENKENVVRLKNEVFDLDTDSFDRTEETFTNNESHLRYIVNNCKYCCNNTKFFDDDGFVDFNKENYKFHQTMDTGNNVQGGNVEESDIAVKIDIDAVSKKSLNVSFEEAAGDLEEELTENEEVGIIYYIN